MIHPLIFFVFLLFTILTCLSEEAQYFLENQRKIDASSHIEPRVILKMRTPSKSTFISAEFSLNSNEVQFNPETLPLSSEIINLLSKYILPTDAQYAVAKVQSHRASAENIRKKLFDENTHPKSKFSIRKIKEFTDRKKNESLNFFQNENECVKNLLKRNELFSCVFSPDEEPLQNNFYCFCGMTKKNSSEKFVEQSFFHKGYIFKRILICLEMIYKPRDMCVELDSLVEHGFLYAAAIRKLMNIMMKIQIINHEIFSEELQVYEYYTVLEIYLTTCFLQFIKDAHSMSLLNEKTNGKDLILETLRNTKYGCKYDELEDHVQQKVENHFNEYYWPREIPLIQFKFSDLFKNTTNEDGTFEILSIYFEIGLEDTLHSVPSDCTHSCKIFYSVKNKKKKPDFINCDGEALDEVLFNKFCTVNESITVKFNKKDELKKFTEVIRNFYLQNPYFV